MRERNKTWLPSWFWRWIVPGLAILGALLLVPRVISRLFLADFGAARADVVGIVNALGEYAINNNGAYPSSLQALVTPDTNGNVCLEGYNNRLPLDPWNHEYQYAPPTPGHPEPRVWSFGADGKLGGTGDNADIDSDTLRENRE
jgi:general secretion pathway protein G